MCLLALSTPGHWDLIEATAIAPIIDYPLRASHWAKHDLILFNSHKSAEK